MSRCSRMFAIELARYTARGSMVADMSELELNDTLDAIIFFESFHHGANHIEMLNRLPKCLEPMASWCWRGSSSCPQVRWRCCTPEDFDLAD